ncbi:MAG: hypothetical protein ABI175_14975, partial [Polyangiales bacterium]
AKQFAAMTVEAKCEAALPRARRCVDELMAQQLESLMDPGASEADKKATAELTKELRGEKSFSDEAEGLHRTNCAASETYADSVVACWPQVDCKAFAACVLAKDAPARPTSPSPSSPSPSGRVP